MALPIVKSAIECGDFSRTVTPYISQLRPLPQLIFESISNPAALKQVYLDTNPLISAFAFSLFLVPIFLLASEINRNYSQVDRVWSILPTLYNAHYVAYAHLAGLDTKRLDALLAASVLWSCRLTYNYWRKGGYTVGSEDYRWEVLRKYISPPLFFIFNVIFISLAQSILLFLIATPTYIMVLAARVATNHGDVHAWNITDVVISSVMIGLVLLTFVGDQQQWNFQNAKSQYQKTAKVPPNFSREELDRGFVTQGLWAYSRHPNFAAEQGVWVTLYQWGCLASGTTYNWTATGAIAYLILFQASTWFTEWVSAGKYPEYKEYQKRVGRFLPKLNTQTMDTVLAPEKKTEAAATDALEARKRYDLR